MATFSENCLSASRLEIPGVIIDAQRKRAHTLGSYDTTSKVTTSESSSSCLAAEHQTVIIIEAVASKGTRPTKTAFYYTTFQRKTIIAMEKTKISEDHADETIPHGSGVSYGLILRGTIELIFVLAYFYLRHGKEYFELFFSNIYMIPIYWSYLLIAADVLIDYPPECKNGDALPVCARKSGTFRDCRCPEEERDDTVWTQILDEVFMIGAGVLMDEILSRGVEYLEA